MATTTIADSRHESTNEYRLRAERGWDLYLAKRQLIKKVGEDTYTVPRCYRERYHVRYGGKVEDCNCKDHEFHPDLSCKHLIAVALLYAKRRCVSSKCEVCGVGSHEKTLIGMRGDRQRDGRRWCLPHHPESLPHVTAEEVLV